MSTTLFPTDAAGDRSPTEALLFRLATDLLRLPFEDRTRKLHIRALELKRLLGQWARAAPSDAERRAARDEIADLQRQAAGWLELLR
jgi:hypothetical protein